MCAAGPKGESMEAIRMKHQVSFLMKVRVYRLTFNAASVNASLGIENDSQCRDHGKQQNRQAVIQFRFKSVVVVSCSPSRALEDPLW